jgi:tetratricopeptide (TPR) repeat protein
MYNHLSRAQVLLEQSRYDAAARELRQQIALTPDDADSHALLALCLNGLDRRQEALDSATRAVHMAPDAPFGHYILGHVYLDMNRYKDAEAAADRAVALDPESARYFALRASIRAGGHQWQAALDDALAGLSVDPDDIGCANMRALCLVKLGRRGEAGTTLESALALDPENDVTHANRGWALLHEGRHREALEHFREALRLNPDQAWARDGIVEALKARNVLYRVLLRYFLWMSRLSFRAQRLVIVGAVVGVNIARAIGDSSPAVAPYVQPLFYAYLAFAYVTWVAKPLSNLLLRMDKFGRYALTRRQIVASNWIGGILALAAVCALVNVWLNFIPLHVAWAACIMLTMPVSASFDTHHPGRRRFLTVFSIALAGLAMATVLTWAFVSDDLGMVLEMLFVVGFVASTWIVGFMRTRR